MKRLVTTLAFAATLTAFAKPVYAADLVFSVTMRAGVTATIRAEILENTDAPSGSTALFVHGLAHTGNTWKPLAASIFSDATLGSTVHRAVLLNLPGRNGSSYPSGALLGDLTLDDYAAIVIRTLDACATNHTAPSALVAHSMGGLILQVVQEKLLSNSSSLASAYGISKVSVIGSAEPAEVPDQSLEDGNGVGLVEFYSKTNAVEGKHVEVTPYVFVGLFFTDKSQQPVSGTPFPGAVVAYGYKSDESYMASLGAVGTSAMRPSVRSGAFSSSNGTILRVIAGSQDPFSDLGVQKSLYEYLTVDTGDAGFIVITANNAVHDEFIIDPAGVVASLGL